LDKDAAEALLDSSAGDLPVAVRQRVNELRAVTRSMLLVAALNDQDSLAEMLQATAILTMAGLAQRHAAHAAPAAAVDPMRQRARSLL
jgi:hypothetical protein